MSFSIKDKAYTHLDEDPIEAKRILTEEELDAKRLVLLYCLSDSADRCILLQICASHKAIAKKLEEKTNVV